MRGKQYICVVEGMVQYTVEGAVYIVTAIDEEGAKRLILENYEESYGDSLQPGKNFKFIEVDPKMNYCDRIHWWD